MFKCMHQIETLKYFKRNCKLSTAPSSFLFVKCFYKPKKDNICQIVLVPTICCEIINECKDNKTYSATSAEPAKEGEEDVKIKQAFTRDNLSSTPREPRRWTTYRALEGTLEFRNIIQKIGLRMFGIHL